MTLNMMSFMDQQHITDLATYELKAGEFIPEYAGKLNFYLSAVDDLVKKPHDNPSMGILLCKTKDKALAEYALKDLNKPMGVSEYQLIESLPNDLGKSLPSVKELEKELSMMSTNDDAVREQALKNEITTVKTKKKLKVKKVRRR